MVPRAGEGSIRAALVVDGPPKATIRDSPSARSMTDGAAERNSRTARAASVGCNGVVLKSVRHLHSLKRSIEELWDAPQ
eukprot:1478896-Alexandrium_andersonii.AAC.1